MDLERIKQNLRLRSGRSKKVRKQPIKQSNATTLTTQPEQKNTPNGDVPEPKPIAKPSSIEEKPSGAEKSQEAATPISSTSSNATTIQKPRPALPHASTGDDLNLPVKTQPPRFGRSGIERPQKESAKEPPITRTMSETGTGSGARDDESSSALDFDLRPPPARPKSTSVETLSESLFSSGHLNVLLRDPQYLTQFTSFLTRYRPQYHPVLLRYLETQKAIKAIEYANAVAEGVLSDSPDKEKEPSAQASHVAAVLDKAFEESSTAAFRLMVDAALPMYITYNLVKVVTECLINEITGRQTPLMRDLVGGLSEVFCLSDPKQEDNPIIYASEEFFRYTGYGADDVIGRNCRFLQGSKTKRESVTRLRDMIAKGEGICEALLNYCRDGKPFINLLMIAPLHDDKGNVKYLFGAQVDVTGLVARGKGLDGFERYLITREMRNRETEVRGRKNAGEGGLRKPKALTKLRELSEMFDLEESAVVRSNSRSGSASRDDDERSIGSSRKGGRRVLSDGDASDNDDVEDADDEDKTWTLGQSGRSGLSGKLPGVYESYLLVRPAPSLRIIFASPKLRQRLGNVVQHPFLSHVAASLSTLKGLKESFGNGESVSAKINFLLESSEQRDGTVVRGGSRLEDAGRGRVCWIAATPMVGSDDKAGVWMVVIVEKTKVPAAPKHETLERTEEGQVPQQSTTGQARPSQKSTKGSSKQEGSSTSAGSPQQKHETEGAPLKPKKLEDTPEPPHNGDSHQADDGGPDRAKESSGNDEQHSTSPPNGQPALQGDAEETSGAIPGSEDVDRLEPFQPKEGEFMNTRIQHSIPNRSPRTDSNEDINGDQEHTETAEKAEEPMSESKPEKPKVNVETPENDDGEDDADTFHNLSDHEGTVTNDQAEDSSDGTPPQSRPGTSGKDSASPIGKGYMDYLRHPGSRPSSEYTRVMSSSFLSGKYDPIDEDQEHGQGDDSDDINCIRSPYSVD